MSNDITAAGSLIRIISQSRQNALKKVNEELINMYWRVGEYLSKESAKASFGDAYIDSIADEIQDAFPGIKGFNRRGLYMMKKFYETYKDDEVVEYAMSRSLSPLMVAEYQLQLPEKSVLQKKLQELINMPLLEDGEIDG